MHAARTTFLSSPLSMILPTPSSSRNPGGRRSAGNTLTPPSCSLSHARFRAALGLRQWRSTGSGSGAVPALIYCPLPDPPEISTPAMAFQAAFLWRRRRDLLGAVVLRTTVQYHFALVVMSKVRSFVQAAEDTGGCKNFPMYPPLIHVGLHVPYGDENQSII